MGCSLDCFGLDSINLENIEPTFRRKQVQIPTSFWLLRYLCLLREGKEKTTMHQNFVHPLPPREVQILILSVMSCVKESTWRSTEGWKSRNVWRNFWPRKRRKRDRWGLFRTCINSVDEFVLQWCHSPESRSLTGAKVSQKQQSVQLRESCTTITATFNDLCTSLRDFLIIPLLILVHFFVEHGLKKFPILVSFPLLLNLYCLISFPYLWSYSYYICGFS